MAGRGRPPKNRDNQPQSIEVAADFPVSKNVDVQQPYSFLVQLRRMARQLGASLSPFASKAEIEQTIETLSPENQEAPFFWEFEDSEGFAVRAVDPEGDWTCSLDVDGHVMLSRFIHPNLNSRRPGQRLTGDEQLQIDDLDGFIERLCAFRQEAYPLLESQVTAITEAKQSEIDQMMAESEINASEPYVDPEEEALKALGAEYGIFLQGEQLIVKICEALGIPTTHTDEKTGHKYVRNPIEDLRQEVLNYLKSPTA